MSDAEQAGSPRPVLVRYRIENAKMVRAMDYSHSVPQEGDEVRLMNVDAEGEEMAAEGFVVDRVEWLVPAASGECSPETGETTAIVKLERTKPTDEEYAEYYEEVIRGD